MTCELCNQVGCSFACMQRQRNEAQEQLKVVELLLKDRMDEAFQVVRGRYNEVYGIATDVLSERDMAYEFLHRWQTWNRQMHNELRIMPPGVHSPDDTQGRLRLGEKLLARSVATEAAVKLREQRNAALLDACQLAEALVVTGAASHPYITKLRPVIERHYRKDQPEPAPIESDVYPYKMTPDLEMALSLLMLAEDIDPEHQVACHADSLPMAYLRLAKAVEAVTEALNAQTAPLIDQLLDRMEPSEGL